MVDEYPVRHWRGADFNNRRELKLYLLKQYGSCYHCGIKVYDKPQVDGVDCDPDTATIDHLVSRRKRKRGEIVEKVLSCYSCNQKLNDKEQSSLTKA